MLARFAVNLEERGHDVADHLRITAEHAGAVLEELRCVLVHLHVAHDEGAVEHGLVFSQASLGGIACIKSLNNSLSSNCARLNSKVHTANGVTEVHAHHSCVTSNNNAVANDLGHHLDAALGNNVTRVFYSLAASDKGLDLRTVLEVLEHLIYRDVLLKNFAHGSYNANRNGFLISINKCATDNAIGAVTSEEPGSTLTRIAKEAAFNNVGRKLNGFLAPTAT